MDRPDLGGLVIVATPIGNLGDISPRAVEALRTADLVACEDTRRTGILLKHIGSAAPMLPAHEHNEAARAQDLVARMTAGATVAFVSDAGMPVISDPGARVVRAAIEAGVPVTVIPGPSAVESALALSGLPVEPCTFVGFFPRKSPQRRDLIASHPDTVVGFESPHRIAALVADLAEVHPDREAAVCRELTKIHEEVLRGTLRELREVVGERVRGEVTVVVGPHDAPPPAEDDLDRAIGVLLDAGLSARSSADVAAKLGIATKNAAYRVALADPRRADT